MGITDKLIVSLADVEERVSEFDVNIEPKKIKNSVLVCQDKFTRSILGDKLYFDLLDKYDAQSGISAPYELLYEYVKAHLISRVCQRSIYIIHNHITNKGVQVGNSDFSNEANQTTVFRTMNIYKSDAEFYENRLWKYLKNNKEDYPLWEEKSDDINKEEPKEDFGIFIV